MRPAYLIFEREVGDLLAQVSGGCFPLRSGERSEAEANQRNNE